MSLTYDLNARRAEGRLNPDRGMFASSVNPASVTELDAAMRRIETSRRLRGLKQMPRRPRMLFLTDVCPLPLDRGQRVRISTLLASCAQVFDVTLLCPATDCSDDRTTLEEQCKQVTWIDTQANAESGPQVWMKTARAVPGVWRPKTLEIYAPFVRAIKQLNLQQYDFIWAGRPHIARLCGSLRARTILDLDDLEHRRIHDAARLPATRVKPKEIPGQLYRYFLYRQLELRSSRDFLASVVCSEEDRAYLNSHGCHNAIVVPNGTATVAARPYRHNPRGALKLVFLGNIAHPPNRDGLIYFIEQILPLIKRAEEDVEFDVIGACERSLQERFANAARFLGYVPDLPNALAQYDVFVAPIRYGSGTRVKLLDGMASQIPIVTTTAGAEGLPIVHGTHALLADTPDAFVESVLAVKRDEPLAHRLVKEGANLIERSFRSAAIQSNLAEWLGKLAVSID